MNPLVVALGALIGTFAAALAGLRLRHRLPDHHLDSESRDAVKLVMGLVATMSALVLGLLVSTTQAAYRAQSDDLALLAANIVVLDRMLLHYGPDLPESQEARRLLRQGITAEFHRILSDDGIRPEGLAPMRLQNPLEPFYAQLQQLRPATDAQRQWLARAVEIGAAISRTRMLMVEQLSSSLPGPFLAVLLFWLAMLFLGFGLMTRLNPTVVVALLIGAISVAGALFLILELDRPFDGLMRLSNAPLRRALAELGDP
ncbi:DUF4239 domain-containing protein [Dankookia sp. GCM10030260]|uniref:bestrophin-like domain n=1 Tax=Dankookia sp. GCM10030260 TaxID=3273390 RepID=UPI00361A1215